MNIDTYFLIKNLPELVELCLVSEGMVVDSEGHILAKYSPNLGIQYSPFLQKRKFLTSQVRCDRV